MPRILIGALTGRNHGRRRDACRASWFADVRRYDNLDAVFLVGGGDAIKQPTRIDDLLMLPCPDEYDTLPQRTNWFCRWALARDDWDYLFKCDDDTFVAVDRLANFQPAGEYVGAEWQDGVRYGSGGAGYLISRRCVELVAEHMHDQPGPEEKSGFPPFPNALGSEDLIVGDVLTRYGIKLVIDRRFIPYHDQAEPPAEWNDTITTHGLPPDHFASLHAGVSTAWPFRIAIPTCDKYAKSVLPCSVELLRRAWPGCPEIDLIHYDDSPPELPGCRRFWCGPSATAWTDGLSNYLADFNRDALVLLMLDDYAACGPVKQDRIRAAARAMLHDTSLAVCYLTWHQTTAIDNDGIISRQAPWAYTVNTQAAIWRRDVLLTTLRACGRTSIEQFELAGSRWFNESKGVLGGACRVPCQDPPEFSHCLDETDKTDWALPYHNLMRRGGADPRWRNWCRQNGVRF